MVFERYSSKSAQAIEEVVTPRDSVPIRKFKSAGRVGG
jgi:hypothetical protein